MEAMGAPPSPPPQRCMVVDSGMDGHKMLPANQVQVQALLTHHHNHHHHHHTPMQPSATPPPPFPERQCVRCFSYAAGLSSATHASLRCVAPVYAELQALHTSADARGIPCQASQTVVN